MVADITGTSGWAAFLPACSVALVLGTASTVTERNFIDVTMAHREGHVVYPGSKR